MAVSGALEEVSWLSTYSQANQAEHFSRIRSQLELLIETTRTYQDSDSFTKKFDSDEQPEIMGEQETINRELETAIQFIGGIEFAELTQAQITRLQEIIIPTLTRTIQNYKLEDLEGPIRTVDEYMSYAIHQIKNASKDEITEPETDAEVMEILEETAAGADARDGCQLISAKDLIEEEILQEKLRKVDERIQTRRSYFEPIKADKILNQILFLENCLYLEEEKQRGITARFVGNYIRVCASFKQNLGLFEQMENYVLENMQAPETALIVREEDLEVEEVELEQQGRLTTLWNKYGSKAIDVGGTGGSAAVPWLFGANCWTIAAFGLLAYGGINAFRWVTKETEKVIEDYKPGLFDRQHYDPFGDCSRVYHKQTDRYQKNRNELLIELLHDGFTLLQSSDENSIEKKGVAIVPEYMDSFGKRYTHFTSNLKSVIEACNEYPNLIAQRAEIESELSRIRYVKNFMRKQQEENP